MRLKPQSGASTFDFFYKAGEDETKGKRKAELLS